MKEKLNIDAKDFYAKFWHAHCMHVLETSDCKYWFSDYFFNPALILKHGSKACHPEIKTILYCTETLYILDWKEALDLAYVVLSEAAHLWHDYDRKEAVYDLKGFMPVLRQVIDGAINGTLLPSQISELEHHKNVICGVCLREYDKMGMVAGGFKPHPFAAVVGFYNAALLLVSHYKAGSICTLPHKKGHEILQHATRYAISSGLPTSRVFQLVHERINAAIIAKEILL